MLGRRLGCAPPRRRGGGGGGGGGGGWGESGDAGRCTGDPAKAAREAAGLAAGHQAVVKGRVGEGLDHAPKLTRKRSSQQPKRSRRAKHKQRPKSKRS